MSSEALSLSSAPALWARRIACVAFTLILWWASIDWPNGIQRGLEPSWEGALVEAHVQGWQFGRDIQFTYGPWGFLSLAFFPSEALGVKLGWEIFGRLAIAVTVVLASSELKPRLRWVFLTISVVTCLWFEESMRALILMLVIVWLLPAKSRWWQRALAIGWMTFFAHHKFVYFAEATASMLLVLAVTVADRRGREGAAMVGGYALAYLGWWMAAGQQLANLPSFLRLSWQISDGYGWSMGIDPTWWQLSAGLAVAALVLALLLQLLRGSDAWPQRLGLVLVLAGGWLLAWKQAFTRADLHMFGFFLYSFLMAFFIFALPGSRRREVVFISLALVVVAPLASLFVGRDLMLAGPRIAWDHLQRRPRELLKLSEFRARFESAEKAAAAGGGVDAQLRALVGRASIDALNYDQGMILVNRLNYTPRPVMQSYSVYTPALLEMNAEFFRSDRAPEFVVVRLDTIDNRLWAQDDSLALLELARRYDLAAKFPDYIVLRRSLSPRRPVSARSNLLASHVPQFGDEIRLPDAAGHPLWIEIDCRPTLLGRLRAFFYHAAELHLVATDAANHTRAYRVLPGAATSGFFIHPWMRDHEDFAAFTKGETRMESIRTFHFDFAKPGDSWFWRRPRVRISSVPELKMR